MIEIFHYTFFWKSLIVAIVIGGIGGFIGTFIYLRGMIFIGAGIAHASFAGVCLALLVGWNPLITGLISGIALSSFIGIKGEDYRMSADTPVGILFTLTMAIALVFVGLMKEYRSDIMSYMFGNILTVKEFNVYLIFVSSIVIIIYFVMYFRHVLFSIFDPDSARISGINVKLILLSLNIILGIFITVSLKSVGVILVLSLLIIPPAASYYLTHYINRMLLYSTIIGIISSALGMFLSVMLNVPTGPSIVLVSGIVFFLSYFVNPRRYECPVFEYQKKERIYDIYKE